MGGSSLQPCKLWMENIHAYLYLSLHTSFLVDILCIGSSNLHECGRTKKEANGQRRACQLSTLKSSTTRSKTVCQWKISNNQVELTQPGLVNLWQPVQSRIAGERQLYSTISTQCAAKHRWRFVKHDIAFKEENAKENTQTKENSSEHLFSEQFSLGSWLML